MCIVRNRCQRTGGENTAGWKKSLAGGLVVICEFLEIIGGAVIAYSSESCV
jgi:hypothetical protein